jgi:hypothetical protein
MLPDDAAVEAAWREPFGFGGWGDSAYGAGNVTGRGAVEFWTRTKKVTTKGSREAGTKKPVPTGCPDERHDDTQH